MTFNDHDIPEKTAAGALEIRKRALGLPARLRTILLLVDGIKPLSELKAMLSAEQALLPALLSLSEMGLLQWAPQQSPSPVMLPKQPRPEGRAISRAAKRNSPAPAPQRSADNAGAPGKQTAFTSDEARISERHVLMSARAHLANALDELLGPDGYLLRQQVAACDTKPQLEALYASIHSSLTPVAGEPDATGIVDHARSLLQATPVKPAGSP